MCDKCGQPYKHIHVYRKPDHPQNAFQCPRETCQRWFGNGDAQQQANPTRSSIVQTPETVRTAERFSEVSPHIERPDFPWLNRLRIRNPFNCPRSSQHSKTFLTDVSKIIQQPVNVDNAVRRFMHQHDGKEFWLSDFVNSIMFESFAEHAFGAKNFSRSPQVIESLSMFWPNRKVDATRTARPAVREAEHFQRENRDHIMKKQRSLKFASDWTRRNLLDIIVPGVVNPSVSGAHILTHAMTNSPDQWTKLMESMLRGNLQTSHVTALELVDEGLMLHPPVKRLGRQHVSTGCPIKIMVSALRAAGVTDAPFGYGKGQCPAAKYSKEWLKHLVVATADLVAKGKIHCIGNETRLGWSGNVTDMKMCCR